MTFTTDMALVSYVILLSTLHVDNCNVSSEPHRKPEVILITTLNGDNDSFFLQITNTNVVEQFYTSTITLPTFYVFI